MKIVPLLFMLAFCLLPGKARASCPLCSCSISVTGVIFGNYVPTAETPSTGQAGVTCLITSGTGNVAYALSASAGSGSFPQRTLKSGTTALGYNLYTSSAYASVWGDGTGGTVTISDGYAISVLTSRSYTIYGNIPASQNVAAGTYADTITVTISY